MPKRSDIQKILVIGSGPITIGQACEFDYSGTQAVKALKEEGYQVILVNSNPATIMTDPEISDRVYLEPLTVDYLEQIIAREKPDALLPTMGGQTALNLTLALNREGVLSKYGVKLLGANTHAIEKAENRELFKRTMEEIGCETAKSALVHNRDEAEHALKEIGLPLILRPSFTLGGEGGGVASTEKEYFEKIDRALFLSPTSEVLVEESLLGWKEFELEVVRDRKDNVIIVCSIENFDPMGVHTGDSITVAPAQTLTDVEYQNLRDQSIRIIRAIGVETGGSNIQFSVNPKTGRVIVIEMNPRVSRSSALASKATGFPIARVAAKLAVGYTLDELTNDITKTTPSSFEPSLDYVITKIPRFDFEKFRPTEPILTTQMKSVGEVMAVGRTFEESLGKAVAGLETQAPYFVRLKDMANLPEHFDLLKTPSPFRIYALADALREGQSIASLYEATGIDPWFIRKLAYILEGETLLAKATWPLSKELFSSLKKRGWTDRALASALKRSESEIRAARESLGIHAHFQRIDTCAAEFEAQTPYLYSSYRATVNESLSSQRKKVMILGGGPNRIGQGIEFDYCCVHATQSLRAMGYETLMVNSNPETVSTDFDLSDKLYFEPLTVEHVLNIARLEKPEGVLVQFGGQTPLKLAKALEAGGLKVLGTSTESIDWAENREKCEALIRELKPLGLLQPEATMARTAEEAIQKCDALGYPVLIRPSYVLGGRGMRIIHSRETLKEYISEAIRLSDEHPVLIDRFLDKASEVDVDGLSDGETVVIGGLMEHIEEAGIHSGDSACSLPVMTLSTPICERIRAYAREIAKRFKVVGLFNLQFAVKGDQIYLLEINPRASRTVPFISKAVGKPMAKIAAQIIMGHKLKDLGYTEDFDRNLATFNVKAPLFPFHKFPGVDVLLGPEMKSTGEVMGRGHNFAAAYAKALAAVYMRMPDHGRVFISVRDEDKIETLAIASQLKQLGFELYATKGTAQFLNRNALGVIPINKILEGSPHCVDAIRDGKFSLVINTTTSAEGAIQDSFSIRRSALEKKIPYCTVLSAARTMVQAIAEQRKGTIEVLPL